MRSLLHAYVLAVVLGSGPGCGDGAGGGGGDDDGDGGGGQTVDSGAPVTDGGARGDAVPSDTDAAPPADDPADDGTYGVRKTDVSVPDGNGATVMASLYAPSDDGGGTVATRGAPFPLVIVSPGFQLPRAQYDSYARHLASWGFVAVAQDFGGGFFPDHAALAAQTSAVIDWALDGASGVASSIDGGRIATAGHSLGGKVSLLAAADDARIHAVVGWDPVDANTPSVTPERMADINGPVVVLGETTNASGGFMPCAPAADNFQQYYAAAPAPALEVTVVAADHMDWVDDVNCGFTCTACTAGTADDTAVKRLTRRTTVAWLRRHLLGDATMAAYLDGAVMQADVAAGLVTIQAK